MKKISSPSHTYVAICNKTHFDGHYCRKFILPKDYTNDTSTACWYFLNRIDPVACLDVVITFEDYSNIKEVS